MLTLVAATLLAQAAPAPGIRLACRGTGGSNETFQGFEDQADILLGPVKNAMRVPRKILPRIRGGSEGWFDIFDLEVTADAYVGRVKINPLNRPRFRIDRRTGVLSLDGRSGQFAGQCQKVAEDAPQQF